MAEEGTLDELRALGHQPMTPMQAIRAHCIDCAGGSASEVAKCAARTASRACARPRDGGEVLGSFFAYGISRSIAHRSTLSAGHGL
jgi:hypothetical protein